jgi:hypothetical protein
MKHPRLLFTIHLLLVCLLPAVVWVLAGAAAEAADDQVPPAHRRPGCQSRCGDVDIPYPFGIGDQCAFDHGFDLTCTRLADGTYRPFHGPFELTNISIPEGKVWTKLNISWQCHDAAGHMKWDTWRQNFTHTPFRISTVDNKFFVIGCNTLGYITSEYVSFF